MDGEIDHVVWTDLARYEHTVAPECFKGGSGSCDGFSEAGNFCSCPCHDDQLEMPDGGHPKSIGDFAVAHGHYWKETEILRAYGVTPVPY